MNKRLSLYVLLSAILTLTSLLSSGKSTLALSQAETTVLTPTFVQCELVLPDHILTSLAQPWQLLPPCHERDQSQSVFVQAVILNTDNGQITSYDPLVIDAGTVPAMQPVLPKLPQHYVSAIFGGGNDDNTILVNNHGDCNNGVAGLHFGQVFFCHTDSLFSRFDAMHVAIPGLGTSNSGQPCPSVRSFEIVDQDQSDNVQTTYLATADGRTAQNNAANRLALTGAVVLKNPSDNRLLTQFVDPAIGCHAWSVPDLSSDSIPVATQFTDEEQARLYQASPAALIPIGDPMTGNIPMTNDYRRSVDQPLINPNDTGSTLVYCSNLKSIAPPFLAEHAKDFIGKPSPAPGVDLNTFINDRYQASLSLLFCP